MTTGNEKGLYSFLAEINNTVVLYSYIEYDENLIDNFQENSRSLIVAKWGIISFWLNKLVC